MRTQLIEISTEEKEAERKTRSCVKDKLKVLKGSIWQ